MADPYDHNQLATLHAMDISFDAGSGAFEFGRVFDFADSPELDAGAVAETWRELVAETYAESDIEATVEVDGDLMTLRFEADYIETRHDLKPFVVMVASEMVMMMATHDTEQAVELTESLVEDARGADDLIS